MLENKKIEEIIKYPLIIKMYNQENFSINKYYSALYANGIAVNIYNKNRELLVKPLSSETNNRFIPSSVNLFQTSFFNLNQLTVPDDTVLKFSEIINLSVRNKITMFSYVQDIGTAELLAKNIKLGDSYYLILFTDNNEVYKYVKENIKGIRVSLLLEDVDLNNYQDKILFTFWSDLSKLNKDEIESKNIKVYAILKKGEEALNVESLSKIRGVMTDLPELNFKQTKNISSRDLYDSVIKSPLKFFGF